MGEPEGFAEYIVARRDALVRGACLLTGDRHLAEDLVQATLVRVWPRWERVSRADHVDAYVQRVQMSIFLSWRRRLWWRESPTASLPDVPDGGDPADGDDRAVLLAAVHRLPARQRAVIVLRYFYDLTEAESADVLGCSTGTVKSHASRAVRSLRSDLSLSSAADSAVGKDRES